MVTDERKIFDDYIRTEGLRETGQRALVLEVFLNSQDHVSVEDIYRLVNRRKRQVGYATVYRTMKLIADCGLAREVMFDDGVCRFEHSVGKQHHHHLVCTNCHRVIEFTSNALDKAEKAIFDEHDFKAEYHHMKIFGLCSVCRKKSGQ